MPLPARVADAATTRVLTISTASASPQAAFKNFDTNVVKVFDIDGDGDLEIIAQNDNQYVYVFDSRTGAILFQVKTKLPAGWGARSFSGPEAAVIEVGGVVRLVVANSAAYVTMFRFDAPGSSAMNFKFIKEWERRLSDCWTGPASEGPSMDAKPVLADLDKDGRFEILGSTEESGVYALRTDGAVYWKRCIGGGNAEPTVGDVNADGWPDVVFGSDGGTVTAMNGRTGATMWSYDARAKHNLRSGAMSVGGAVAQLDGLGGMDVVVGAKDTHDTEMYTNDHALLLALTGAGKLLWARQDPIGNPTTYTRAIVVDAADDGAPEVYWGDWNTIGHKGGIPEEDWYKVMGPAHFYRYDRFGTMVWRQTLDTDWSNKDLALADVDDDGVQEVLANGPGGGGDGIWYLDSRNGAKETFVSTFGWKVSRGPIVADLWNTGTMQWLVAVSTLDSKGGGILVYDTHNPYSAKWPHVPYPTLGPDAPPPPPPPPPPSGPFNATFTIKSPNAWWQEVFVTPDEPRDLSKVEVRVSGGAWRSMTLRSWGAWTSSYNTPAGTMVEFLATDAGGGTSQSAPFTWLDGTLTQRNVAPGSPPPPPPPPGDFTATFTVSPNINEWWVEVKVTATETVSAVDCRVNGGSSVQLNPTSWGTWAKSFRVLPGSTVQFRATGSSGSQVLSGNTTWLA